MILNKENKKMMGILALLNPIETPNINCILSSMILRIVIALRNAELQNSLISNPRLRSIKHCPA